jgi:hypothetical protein
MALLPLRASEGIGMRKRSRFTFSDYGSTMTGWWKAAS